MNYFSQQPIASQLEHEKSLTVHTKNWQFFEKGVEEQRKKQKRLAQRKFRQKRRFARYDINAGSHLHHTATYDASSFPPSDQYQVNYSGEIREIEKALVNSPELLDQQYFEYATISQERNTAVTAANSGCIELHLSTWDQQQLALDNQLNDTAMANLLNERTNAGNAERRLSSGIWLQTDGYRGSLAPMAVEQILTTASSTEEPIFLRARVREGYQSPSFYNGEQFSKDLEPNNWQSPGNIPRYVGHLLSLSSNLQGQLVDYSSRPPEVQKSLEKAIEAIRENGFDTFDALAIVYYTTNLDENTALGYAQSCSRDNRLAILLRAICESMAGWSEGERQGCHAEVMRAAKIYYVA